MAVIAGLNLNILDATDEAVGGKVTLKNPTALKINSGILAFNYAKLGGSSDTAFTVKLKAILNPATMSTDQNYFTESAAGAVSAYARTVTASTISGKLFWQVDFPAPITYLIVEIQWVGTFLNLSPLTVNFIPNSFQVYGL